MKKQFLHESHNRKDKALNEDYLEKLREEKPTSFGGVQQNSKLTDEFFKFRGTKIFLNMDSVIKSDKKQILERLLYHVRFSLGGFEGSIMNLAKKKEIAEEVALRLRLTRNSILRADSYEEVIKHPTKNKYFKVIPVNCFFKSIEPFNNLIFCRYFAFRVTIIFKEK